MFLNQKVGIIILFCHLISALLNGLIYRNFKFIKHENIHIQNTTNKSSDILNECMTNSIKSILLIGAYIAIFFLITNIITSYNLFLPLTYSITKLFKTETLEPLLNGFLNGMIEVTQGCLNISGLNLNLKTACIICTALVSFGGFSIHMQAYTFLKSANIKYSFFLLQKITHTIISVIIACVASFIFL